jgi:plasmid stability protein
MGIVNIRDVPEELHEALKQRAAREGTSMAELIRRELSRIAYKPSLEGIAARARRGTSG